MNAIARGVVTATVDGIAVRLSDLARKNEIEGMIKIGDECYQLGEPSILPDGYERFRWVTEDQFESLLPPGINQDRYITITNMIPSDEAIEEWYANWNDPEYWSAAAENALEHGERGGAYRTTRNDDQETAASVRALAASQIAVELVDGGDWIERTPENIGLLRDIAETVHDMNPESDLGLDQNAADQLIWDNRASILKSIGLHADDMPADLVERVCIMDEQASVGRAKSFGKWWIGPDTNPMRQDYELQGYGQPIPHSDSYAEPPSYGQPSYGQPSYGLSAPYPDSYANQATGYQQAIPDPDPAIDPTAGTNPMNPGIGM